MPQIKGDTIEQKMAKAALRQTKLKLQQTKKSLDNILRKNEHLYANCLEHVHMLGYSDDGEGIMFFKFMFFMLFIIIPIVVIQRSFHRQISRDD